MRGRTVRVCVFACVLCCDEGCRSARFSLHVFRFAWPTNQPHNTQTHTHTHTHKAGSELKLGALEQHTVVAPATLTADANGNGTSKSMSFSEKVRVHWVLGGWMVYTLVDIHIHTHPFKQAKKALMHGVSVDIHEIIHTDETVGHIHASAEVRCVCRVARAVLMYIICRRRHTSEST